MLLALLITIVLCSAVVKNQPDVAFLYDDSNIFDTHSDLIRIVEGFGHEISYYDSNRDIVLSDHTKNIYDHLIIIASKKDVVPKFSLDTITNFLDNGGNMLLIVDTEVPSQYRKLINNVGFSLLTAGSFIGSSLRTHIKNTIEVDISKDAIDASPIINKSIISGSLLYKGSGLRFDPSNKRSLNILNAPSDSFIYSKKTNTVNPSFIKSDNAVLIGAYQMRNDHRVVIIPSVDFVSNEYFHNYFTSDKSKKVSSSVNEDFTKEIILWNFQQKAVLRVASSKHYALKSNETESQYTVMEMFKYCVKIEEKTLNGWIPFQAHDVQFTLERMVYHMRHRYLVEKDGTFCTTFAIPDYIGLYKLLTYYDRANGYNVIDHYQQIAVRPRRHDGHPRFVIKCWPCYFTVFVMMALSFVLLVVVTNIKEEKRKID